MAGPQGPADTSATTVKGVLPGPVSSSDDLAFESLGGPTVNVTVPASGLIDVVASAIGSGDDGVASLYEDGAQMPGQGPDLGGGGICGGPAGELFGTFSEIAPALRWGTPLAVYITACGSFGAPGPVTFQTTPGPHTYELRYAWTSCGCPAGTATFSDVRLWITPRP